MSDTNENTGAQRVVSIDDQRHIDNLGKFGVIDSRLFTLEAGHMNILKELAANTLTTEAIKRDTGKLVLAQAWKLIWVAIPVVCAVIVAYAEITRH